jgi:hypothetical protein
MSSIEYTPDLNPPSEHFLILFTPLDQAISRSEMTDLYELALYNQYTPFRYLKTILLGVLVRWN